MDTEKQMNELFKNFTLLQEKLKKEKESLLVVTLEEAIKIGLLFETDSEKFFIFDNDIGYWRQASDKWEALSYLDKHYFEKKDVKRPSSRECYEFIQKHFRIPSLDTVRRKWEKELFDNSSISCIYFKNKAYFIQQKEKIWIKNEIPVEVKKEKLVNKWLDIESKLHQSTMASNFNYEHSIEEQVEKHLPKLYKFLFNLFNYKTKVMRQELIKALLEIQALLFYKNMSNLNTEITLQKLILLIGVGGSGKSTVVTFFEKATFVQDIASTEINHLQQRFDSSNLRNRSLIQLNDEDSISTDRRKAVGHRFMSSAIKTLTGGDLKRVEEKFKTPTMFRNYGFVIGSTNSALTMANPADFTAMKRRLVPFYFNNPPLLKDQDTKYIESLFSESLEPLLYLYIINYNKRTEFHKDIKNFDFENLLYKNKEQNFYQSQSSSISGFLHEVFLPEKTVGPKIDLTITQLKILFTQYLIYRPNSTIQVDDIDGLANQFKELIQLPVVKNFPFKETLAGDLLPLAGVPQIFNTAANTFEESVKEHLRFFENKPLPEAVTIRKRYNVPDSEGQLQELRAQTRVYKNVQINWEWFTVNDPGKEIKLPYQDYNFENSNNTIQMQKRYFSTKLNQQKQYLDDQLNILKHTREEILQLVEQPQTKKELGEFLPANLLKNINLTLNTEVYNFTEEELEQQIVKSDYKKEKLNFGIINELKLSFQKKFDKDLGSLLFKTFVECVCYQATEKNIYRSDEKSYFEMVLNPFFMQVFSVIYKYIYPRTEDVEKLHETWDFSFDLEAIKKTIEEHKKTRPRGKKLEKWPEEKKLEYEKKLKALNNKKADIKKKQKNFKEKIPEKTRKPVTDQEHLFEEYLLKILSILFDLGFNLEVKTIYKDKKPKKIRVIQFPEGQLYDWFEVWADLSNKPMLQPPHPYKLSSDNKEITCGGYSLMNQLQIGRLFLTEDLTSVQHVSWNPKLIQEINLLQSLPFNLNVGLIIPLINVQKKLFISKAKELLEKFYEKEESKRNRQYTKSEISSLLYNIFRFFRFCKMLLWVLRDYPFCQIYFPMHLDRAFRMHTSGELNFVNSKDLRLLLIFPFVEKSLDLIKKENENFQWFLNCQTTKMKTKDSRAIEVKTERSPLKNQFYPIYKENQEINNFTKAAWFDATSSSLQIQCLLFGLIEFAGDLNLRNQPYTDIISEWAPKIILDDPFLDGAQKNILINDRNVLKMEVMIQLYGGTQFSSLNRITEHEAFSNGVSNEIKRLRQYVSKQIHDFVSLKLEFILKYYSFIKDYHRVLFKQKEDLVTFTNQDCQIKFKHVPTKERILAFNTNIDNKIKKFKITIDVPVPDKVDIRRTLNILPPLQVHSIDAAIAKRIRLHIYNKYGVNIVTIHDAFGIPAELLDEVQTEYKKALFEYAFDRCPFEMFCLDFELIKQDSELNERFIELKNQIDKNKSNAEWENIRKESAPYCLYPE